MKGKETTYHHVTGFAPSEVQEQVSGKSVRAEYIIINVIDYGQTKKTSQVERAD